MLKQAASSRLIPVILDVTDERSIAEAFQRIRETVGAAGLVGLVNNAGVGVTAPIELVPLEELRRQFDVNVIGQVAVIQAFLPLIRAAHGRIITVGSEGYPLTYRLQTSMSAVYLEEGVAPGVILGLFLP